MVKLSTHAHKRVSQRGLTMQEVYFVLNFGRRIFRTGIRFVFLAARDIPRDLMRSHGHLVGATLLVGGDDTLLTVYKNPQALATIKKKRKNARAERSFRPAFAAG